MGYESFISGSLRITPMVPESAWPPDFTAEGDASLVLTQQDGSETVTTVNGKIVVVGQPGSTIAERRFEESVRNLEIEGEVTEIVDMAKAAGSIVNGVIDVDGEEDRDIWRVRVADNEVFLEQPKLLWPNGEEEIL